ncbi:MAG: FecR domain-containing protein [Odoribacteraceae bacterium]|jgi:ferric-dicitrate binding protein FerR (iron transport regulator)|nr:FecR domain-containing protein [Odoribacteraceae bacterium]
MEEKLFRLTRALAARFTGDESPEDKQIIEEWIDGDEHRAALVRGIMDKKRFEANREETRLYPAGKAWKRFRRATGRGHWSRVLYPVAATILLAGVLSVFRSREMPLPVAMEEDEEFFFHSGTTGALLTLDDGRIVNIDKQTALLMTERDGTTIIVDSSGMDYHLPVETPAEEVYNEVRTPTGMEFPLTLSDGTRVYLNAESRLRFPVHFPGDTREVELEGEAFFEVTPDAARPFTVRSGGIATRVLGTSFNTRAYGNERLVVTTLVEGRVELLGKQGRWEITAGEQGCYVKATGACEVRRVDADLYTAWRSGKFIFRNERLEDILSYLSRWYGFEYEFRDEAARDIEIGTSLDRYRDMEPIVRILQTTDLAHVVRVGNKLEIYSK